MKNQTILITGASEGIGQELALQLAARGAQLGLAARNETKLAEVARQCEQAGARVLAVATDVARPEDCRALLERTVAHFGGLDVLVNNAGISMSQRFEDVTDLAVFERLMRVNYLGAVYCTHYALPHLKARGGLLVAISSLQGLTGFPLSSGYNASKHAMQGFFDSLRIELDGSGVAVLVVSPGAVTTNIHVRKLAGGQANHTVKDGRGLMPVSECARQIVRAMERRDRDLLMTPLGKLLPWLKLIAPNWVDRRVAQAVRRFNERLPTTPT